MKSKQAFLLVLFVGTAAAGCSSWRKTEAPLVAQLAAEKTPHEVRVQLADGSKHIVEEPRVVGDSLVGTGVHESGGSIFRDPKQARTTYAVAVDSVRVTERKKFDPGKTGLVVLGAAAMMVGFYTVAAFANGLGL